MRDIFRVLFCFHYKFKTLSLVYELHILPAFVIFKMRQSSFWGWRVRIFDHLLDGAESVDDFVDSLWLVFFILVSLVKFGHILIEGMKWMTLVLPICSSPSSNYLIFCCAHLCSSTTFWRALVLPSLLSTWLFMTMIILPRHLPQLVHLIGKRWLLSFQMLVY